jgi:hypothetical protein
LNYSLNGITQTPVNITSTMLPFSLPTVFTGASATYALTGFTYNNGADTGVVDPTPVTAFSSPTAANAGINQSVCGITSVTLGGNNSAPFNGTWSIVNGAGGTLFEPNDSSCQFNGILPNTYKLQWAISNGVCQSTSDVTIAFTTRPSPPVALSPQTICDTTATIANITVSASTGYVYWFTSAHYPPVLPALSATTALTNGATYYADAVSGTCVSAAPLTPVKIIMETPPQTTAIHHDN